MTTKPLSIAIVWIPLLFASVSLILKACSLLKQNPQKTNVITKIPHNLIISFGVILKISPTIKPEYCKNAPFLARIARPTAVPSEENTEITVSVDKVFLRLIQFNKKANAIANTIIEILVSDTPRITPIAIPVKAECPSASEKNAILLFTIIVPKIPNNGVIMSMASNAFFIKSYCIN